MMLVLFDGVCGLCNGWVRFAIERDRTNVLRFATLQGEAAARILQRHGKDPRDLDTMYVVVDPDTPRERVLTKARGVLTVVASFGGLWRLVALLRHLPEGLLDLGYGLVARNRYRWFGKLDSCPIPTPDQRARFVD